MERDATLTRGHADRRLTRGWPHAQVRLQVSRVADGGPCKPCEGEVFAVLEVLRSNGEMLVELASDLWTLRTDLVRRGAHRTH